MESVSYLFHVLYRSFITIRLGSTSLPYTIKCNQTSLRDFSCIESTCRQVSVSRRVNMLDNLLFSNSESISITATQVSTLANIGIKAAQASRHFYQMLLLLRRGCHKNILVISVVCRHMEAEMTDSEMGEPSGHPVAPGIAPHNSNELSPESNGKFQSVFNLSSWSGVNLYVCIPLCRYQHTTFLSLIFPKSVPQMITNPTSIPYRTIGTTQFRC